MFIYLLGSLFLYVHGKEHLSFCVVFLFQLKIDYAKWFPPQGTTNKKSTVIGKQKDSSVSARFPCNLSYWGTARRCFPSVRGVPAEASVSQPFSWVSVCGQSLAWSCCGNQVIKLCTQSHFSSSPSCIFSLCKQVWSCKRNGGTKQMCWSAGSSGTRRFLDLSLLNCYVINS